MELAAPHKRFELEARTFPIAGSVTRCSALVRFVRLHLGFLRRVLSDVSDCTTKMGNADMPEASGIYAEASGIGQSWLISDSRTRGVP